MQNLEVVKSQLFFSFNEIVELAIAAERDHTATDLTTLVYRGQRERQIPQMGRSPVVTKL